MSLLNRRNRPIAIFKNIFINFKPVCALFLQDRGYVVSCWFVGCFLSVSHGSLSGKIDSGCFCDFLGRFERRPNSYGNLIFL